MLVLEQLVDHVERLPPRHGEEFAADRGARQQRLALVLRQRLGVALRHEDVARDLFGLAVPVAECLRVLLGEARDVGDRLFEIAAEHQRPAVAMRLAEFVARRDVGDACRRDQVLEPRRIADVEMIDRMEVVIEAGHR